MSQASDLGALSTDELLQIEAVCDRFEGDLRRGVAQPLESYWQNAPCEIQPHLRVEIEQLKVAQDGEAALRTCQDDQSVVDTGETRQVAGREGLAKATSAGSLLQGRFELVEQIGAGGNGAVWKARDHELQRWVAVKIPHRATIGDSARFIREARAAAQLQHANIVRVHEVGEDQGTCYLVSELIEGESLAEELQRRTLPLREAIGLLAKVVDAIDAAHRLGVVHRDLKPQNILVDSAGQPYVTDFGIAKNSNLDDATITLDGQLLGTPAYMAPEQARGASNEADGRTDVYSLGVVLFKLLTGDVPFHGSLESVVYQVIHLDAPTPRRWNRSVPRDLETICLKCLEKSPARRFASADELREELTRFLAGKPIRSRPVPLSGHAWKWVQRNRRLAALATASSLLLVTIAIGSTVAAVLLNQARGQESAAKAVAISARQLAESEARVSRETIAFLESIFETSDPVAWVLSGEVALGANPPAVKDLFSNAAQRIRNELKGQPLARARLMDILGNACRGIGLFDDARSLLAEAANIRAANRGSDPQREFHSAAAISLFYRAWLSHDLAELDQAESLYKQSLVEITAGGNANSLLAAHVQFHLGRLLLEQQRNEEAETLLLESVKIRSEQLPADSRLITASKLGLQFSRTPVGGLPALTQLVLLLQSEDWGSAVASDFAVVMFHRESGDFRAACEGYGRILVELRNQLGEQHPFYVLARGDYAGLLWSAGNYREAYPIAREVIAAGRTMAPGHRHLRGALLRLGSETLYAGRIEEADGYYREVQQMTDPQRFDFELEHGLLWTSFASDRIDEALSHSGALLAHVDQYVAQQTAWVNYAHARVLEKAGKAEEAQKFDDRALVAVKAINAPLEHPLWTERMALVYSKHNELAKSHELVQHAYELETALRPPNHPRIADRLVNLGKSHLRAGRADEAVRLLQRAYDIRKRWLPEDDGRIETTGKELERARRAAESSTPQSRTSAGATP